MTHLQPMTLAAAVVRCVARAVVASTSELPANLAKAPPCGVHQQADIPFTAVYQPAEVSLLFSATLWQGPPRGRGRGWGGSGGGGGGSGGKGGGDESGGLRGWVEGFGQGLGKGAKAVLQTLAAVLLFAGVLLGVPLVKPVPGLLLRGARHTFTDHLNKANGERTGLSAGW